MSFAETDFTLAYVLGTGHSGSTLLSMLLNGHSQMVGLGEVHKLRQFITRPRRSEDNPLLRPLWQEVAACCARVAGVSLQEIELRNPPADAPEDTIRRWVVANHRVLSCTQAASGARVLVDTSHDARRLLLLEGSGMFTIRVIHLVRDGRAVINSYRRKYGRFGRGLLNWLRASIAARHAFGKIPTDRRIRIRYEDLARDPTQTLQRLCAFLGMPYEPRMMAFRSHPYAGVSGNRTRRGGDETITLDHRWRREMPLAQKVVFSIAGGWLNRLNGY